MPISFWPFSSQMFSQNELAAGRATFFWNERIGTSWGSFFGNQEKYLSAACQFEFILEFNSWLGVNNPRNETLGQWLQANAKDKYLQYNPDLFAYNLQLTLSMAERFYGAISEQGTPHTFYEVVPKLFTTAFNKKSPQKSLPLFGCFLNDLKSWQDTAMLSHRRFPFMFSWKGRLGEIVRECQQTSR